MAFPFWKIFFFYFTYNPCRYIIMNFINTERKKAKRTGYTKIFIHNFLLLLVWGKLMNFSSFLCLTNKQKDKKKEEFSVHTGTHTRENSNERILSKRKKNNLNLRKIKRVVFLIFLSLQRKLFTDFDYIFSTGVFFCFLILFLA